MIGERCGVRGFHAQHDRPVWKPLERAIGERLAAGFMWMHEVELWNGVRLHAYKHIYTRRYLYLTEGGKAYDCAPCGCYVAQRLDYALEVALCGWWILAGWDAEDAAAIRDAIVRANRGAAGEH